MAVLAVAPAAAAQEPTRRTLGIEAVRPSALPVLALDRGFGAAGTAERTVPNLFSIGSLATTPDGAVLLGGSGWSAQGLNDLAGGPAVVIRLTPSGSMDPGFGEGGLLAIPSTGAGLPGPPAAAEILLDAEGRILVKIAGLGRSELRRYGADGTLDTSFGVGGTINLSALAGGLMVAAPDGGVLLAAGSGSTLRVSRLRADGSPDPGFGQSGTATVASPGPASGLPDGALVDLLHLAVDGEGRPVLATSWRAPGSGSAAIVRLDGAGRPDPSFDGDGFALIPRYPADIVTQPDGGVAYVFSGSRVGLVFPTGVGRLDAAGRPDEALGREGLRLLPVGPTTGFQPHLLARPDGGLAAVAGNIVTVLDDRARPVEAFGRHGSARIPGRGTDGMPSIDGRGRLVVYRGQSIGPPLPPHELTLRVLRAPLAVAGGRRAVSLTAAQLLINQRIAQAAVRRVNALQALVDGEKAPTGSGGDPGAVELSAGQLRISQRIAQAAVRRINSLAALVDGEPEPEAAAGQKGRVALTVGQLRINQRIAQAAIRRAAALAERIPDLPVPHPPENTFMDGVVGVAVGPRKIKILQVPRGPATVGTTIALVLPPELRSHELRNGETVNAAGVSAGSTFYGFYVSIEPAPGD